MIDKDTDALRLAITSLSDRVAALEGARNERSAPTAASGDALWALSGLRERLAEHPSTEKGAVMIVGSITTPTGAVAEWQQGAGTEGLFEVDWGERAAGFAALAHPVRLELLRHVMSGTTSTSGLAAIESLGTTGQLHHHLRQLLATGWLKQSGRGSYEVPAARAVPLLACLVAVER
ncbi:hypothetical protein M2152_002458 [Microbacteriaceae bacterium SG_E_30_P1]|uniref:ArsR family transcriptional regulator n=1 Tax=Antiquaquibacter oligotrophicus TaxID=2880260 RepID=A0ABT6KR27_9MICO|nr:helix-turn-helix domain-containing protein [Antiquaquibacter oligotrophicus]MDH6182276.1 hypothetical protein [Antiquaquibacter oligotrophicus]UDF12067.1 helix-turn-helix domain-containing protein [Antiquaquibacter oligotrophicus]